MNADDIEACQAGAAALLDEASRCNATWQPEHEVARQAAERRAGLMRRDAARLVALADNAERVLLAAEHPAETAPRQIATLRDQFAMAARP